MKFFNRKKEYRDTWTTVEGPAYYQRAELKRWCQQHPSTGRFYFGPFYFPRGAFYVEDKPDIVRPWPWYFEDPQDALAFKLVWQNSHTK